MLIEPTKDFFYACAPIKPAPLEPDKLLRITRFGSGEPFFERSGANRFDDYRKRKQYGTCYFGQTLNVAFAETVLHDEMPIRGHFHIAADDLEKRYVVRFLGDTLQLLDLTGNNLKNLGISSSLTTVTCYDLTQKWSVAVHNHANQYDGFMYMSRHMTGQKAVVLFDRAAPKISVKDYTLLPDYPGALRAAMTFNLRFI